MSRLPGHSERPVGDEAIRVAILGRPNVGKSSLLNALLGRERVIVSEVPGTTRDSIDTVLRRDDSTFVLVDTAGLRRKRKQRQGIEYYSELRALEAAERADVALVLVDASQGRGSRRPRGRGRRPQGAVRRRSSSSRSGTSPRSSSRTRGPRSSRRMRQRPPLIAISAHTGRGLERLLALVEAVFVPYAGRITTAQLNRALQELREARQPPGRRGRRLNLLYGTQVSSRPPRFRFFVNDRSLVTRDYGYWVENELRARFGLGGGARLHRLRHLRMRIVVVGAGSWGTAVACLLRDNGHEVTLAARDPAQADAINATGRNPRYARSASLAGIVAAPIPDAPVASAELVVVAVPSRVFGDVVCGSPAIRRFSA